MEVGRPTTAHRYGQTATVLADGRVLAAGGHTWASLEDPSARNVVGRGAEVFDPTALTWVPTGALVIARTEHQTSALIDGRALATGGESEAFSEWTALASAELYDPVAGSWSLTQSMHEARTHHAQVRLADGRIWVAGGTGVAGDQGLGTAALASVEVFDPADQTWTRWAPLSTAEPMVDAILLGDGRLLVMGEFHVELYDPAVGSQPAPPPPPPYRAPTRYAPNEPVVCVGPGLGHATALASGGAHVLALQMSLLITPERDVMGCRSLLGPAQQKASPVASLALESGKLLFTFGAEEVALLDPGTGVLTALPPLIHRDRGAFHLLLLPDGSALVTGGSDDPSEVLRWN
jgi:hypothetical protein